jgi:proline iminopeptidase
VVLGQVGPIRRGSLRVHGSQLDYVIEGRGLTCLVIGSSIYYPRTFSKALRRHLRLIFVDLPWFAPVVSSLDPASESLESIVGDVDEIRRQLKLERPILVGHSIHGTIAMEYARRRPQNVSRLVLIGAPIQMTSAAYDASTAQAWATASPDRQRLQNRNWSAMPDLRKRPDLQPDVENYLAMAPKYWFNPRYDARWLWAGMTIHSALLQNLYTGVFRGYDMFGKNRSVPVDTYVAVGRYDYVVPNAAWLKARGIPNLTLQTFSRSGHTPQLEEPGPFDHRLLRWLAGARSLGARRRNL